MSLLHLMSQDNYDDFLAKEGRDYVARLIAFLSQLKTPRPYEDIPQASVRGFSSSDIESFLMKLTLLFGISPVGHGADNTFKITSTLTREIEELEAAIERDESYKPYLVLENNVFRYHGSQLEIIPTGFVYIILRTIYEHLNGKSGNISYKDLSKMLSKLPRFKRMTKSQIAVRIRRNMTAKSEGLYVVLNRRNKKYADEPNGRKLIGVVRGVGIYFNNGDK